MTQNAQVCTYVIKRNTLRDVVQLQLCIRQVTGLNFTQKYLLSWPQICWFP